MEAQIQKQFKSQQGQQPEGSSLVDQVTAGRPDANELRTGPGSQTAELEAQGLSSAGGRR
jgi:hypothetical protein